MYAMTTRCGVALVALMLQLLLPSASAHAQSTRDSANVRIVENRAPRNQPARAARLALAPSLDLDPTQGDVYNFGGVLGVIRLANGRTLVAARTAPQFRLFDSQGRLLYAINESGVRESLSSHRHGLARLNGDTIAVEHSFSVGRLVVSGDSLRDVSAPPAPMTGPPSEIGIAVLMNGDIASVAFPKPTNHDVGVEWVDSTQLLLRDRGGTLIRDLGRVPYGTFQMSPIQKQPSTVWLSATPLVCAGNGRLYFGFGDAYDIQVYSARGALESRIRRAWTPTPVTGADWEHWVVEWSRIWVKERGEDSLKAVQRVRDEPYAFTLPAFAGCLVAQNGDLWVREAHLDDAISAGSLSDDPIVTSRWSVFDSAGRWLHDVTMPARFQPLDIGADYVAGRLRKSPGRMAMVVYRLSSAAR